MPMLSHSIKFESEPLLDAKTPLRGSLLRAILQSRKAGGAGEESGARRREEEQSALHPAGAVMIERGADRQLHRGERQEVDRGQQPEMGGIERKIYRKLTGEARRVAERCLGLDQRRWRRRGAACECASG